MQILFTWVIIMLVLKPGSFEAAMQSDEFCLPSNTTDVGKCYFGPCPDMHWEAPAHLCPSYTTAPLMCCPVKKKILPGVRSSEKCKDYFPMPCGGSTGYSQGYLAGYALGLNRSAEFIHFGELPLSKEFPHLAAVGFNDEDNIWWLCAGSLISEKFVLTDTNCAKSTEFGAAKWVRLGDLPLGQPTKKTGNAYDLAIKKIHQADKYLYKNLALLELAVQVVFGMHIQPACLHTTKKVPKSGFEEITWSDSANKKKRFPLKTKISVISHANCTRMLKPEKNFTRSIKKKSHVCGVHHLDDKNFCQKTSGGILHFFKKESLKFGAHFIIVGFNSFGKSCVTGNDIHVYTRVSEYLDWIENIVWPIKLI